MVYPLRSGVVDVDRPVDGNRGTVDAGDDSAAALAGPWQPDHPNDLPPWMPPPEGLDPSWWPLNYIQQAALRSPAQLLLYGGQAGGGKTGFLVGDAMQERYLPSFRGLLLRESLGEFDQIGDLMEAAYHTYLPPNERARYRTRSGGGQWIFPILNKTRRSAEPGRGKHPIRLPGQRSRPGQVPGQPLQLAGN
jgi:hypothetical protein